LEDKFLNSITVDKKDKKESNCKNLIDKIFKENYVSKNTLDFIS